MTTANVAQHWRKAVANHLSAAVGVQCEGDHYPRRVHVHQGLEVSDRASQTEAG